MSLLQLEALRLLASAHNAFPLAKVPPSGSDARLIEFDASRIAFRGWLGEDWESSW